MRVALFLTCVNELLYPATGQAVVRILRRLGHDVDFPVDQTCCGRLHGNGGYRPEAARLARRFCEVFEGYEAVVVPSGSCAAMVREGYPRLAAGDPGLARQVEAVAPAVFELSELLVDVLGVTDVGGYFPHRVTYHASCHGLRLLRLGDRPVRLLRAVRGIELVDLPRCDECCGFGGGFAVNNTDVSTAMLTDKCRHILGTGAEVVAASDNSCLAHIGGGLTKQRGGVRAMHYAEILASTPNGVA